MSAFSLLASPIQEVLVRKMGWTHLRPIQADAIRVILGNDSDLIISASTASGKTEAAFLPILSRIAACSTNSIQAIYVSPLKALINDQFRRLDELCQLAEIPVHRWHGDVARNKKRDVERSPRGVLLITPESLESLFINRTSMLRKLFTSLQFVVLDELHAFVGSERGTHLRSLLCRLERYCEEGRYRIVGLSATLGGARSVYARWMRPHASDRVVFIEDSSEKKAVHYKIYGYAASGARREWCVDHSPEPAPGDDSQLESEEGGELIGDMLTAFAGRTNLIFSNAKSDVERFADSLNGACRRLGRPEEFLVHHGSLSKEVREETERLMRGRRPFTTICSSTLELGIDIGNVCAVGQIGAPWSVNSLVQRLGRSGRRDGEAQTMRMYIQGKNPGVGASLVDQLHPEVLQAVALTELMLQKPRWLEPPVIDELDFSTLVQQILSVIAESGGLRADELFQRLVGTGAFSRVERHSFVAILKCLGFRDLIEQAADGNLILGLVGEKIVKSYEFYSAFLSPVEYRVVNGARPVGSLPATAVPALGDHILLAARRWLVQAVDERRQEIAVVPATGRKAPLFLGGGGNIHSGVRRKMRDVLLARDDVPYLNAEASQWLREAREVAKVAQISHRVLFGLNGRRCLWLPWIGTRGQRTLIVMGKRHGLEAREQGMGIECEASIQSVIDVCQKIVSAPQQPRELAEATPFKRLRKFDEYLSDELLNVVLADGSFDVEEATQAASQLLASSAMTQKFERGESR